MLSLYPVGFLQVIQDLEKIITVDARGPDGKRHAQFLKGGERVLANLWAAFLFLLKEASPDSGVEFNPDLTTNDSHTPHRSAMRAVAVSEEGVTRLQAMNDAFEADFAAMEVTRRGLVQRRQEQQVHLWACPARSLMG